MSGPKEFPAALKTVVILRGVTLFCLDLHGAIIMKAQDLTVLSSIRTDYQLGMNVIT